MRRYQFSPSNGFGFGLLVFLALFLNFPQRGRCASPTSLQEEVVALDAQLEAQLWKIDPDAVTLFQEARAQSDAQQFDRARDTWGRLFARLPTFSPAVRREAWAEWSLGLRKTAISHARQALSLEPNADNYSALALMLGSSTEDSQATTTEITEALGYAQTAVRLAPDSLFARVGLAETALTANNSTLALEAAEELIRRAPREPTGEYLRALAQANLGELDAAERSLETARANGLDAATYRGLHEAIEKSQPASHRWFGPLIATLALWLGGFGLLFGLGALLSRWTLRTAARLPTKASGQAQGLAALLRRVYQAVIGVSCLFYWLSQPLVFVLVFGAAAGLIYLCFAIGHIPIYLILALVVGTLSTMAAMLRGMFTRPKDEDPGLPLELASEPRFAALLNEVAKRVGTRPVDTLYLTPGTDLAVMERGNLLRQMSGRANRCLILGVGVLDGMTLGPFKSILAHEYGHFSNKDTSGGQLALAVRRSLHTTAAHLVEDGNAKWFNPAWLFLYGFYKVFLRISQGASRLQEVMADRWAAFLYGTEAFKAGLGHVVRRAIEFQAYANASIQEVAQARQPLPNLYAHRPTQEIDHAAIDEEFKRTIAREPSPYDSHPSPAHRFAWVEALGVPSVPEPHDQQAVWSLFDGREAIETQLTEVVRHNLLSQGIELPKPPVVQPATL